MKFDLIEISFSDILYFWRTNLWPERKSEIEPVSAIDSNGLIDINIIKKYQSTYFCYKKNDFVAGIISCCRTSDFEIRARGLWVDPTHRGENIGTKIIKEVQLKYCVDKQILWTMARENSVNFYIKNGFRFKKQVLNYEYGPHQILTYENQFESNLK